MFAILKESIVDSGEKVLNCLAMKVIDMERLEWWSDTIDENLWRFQDRDVAELVCRRTARGARVVLMSDLNHYIS